MRGVNLVFCVVGRLLCRTVCLLSIFASFWPLYFPHYVAAVALIEERIEVEFYLWMNRLASLIRLLSTIKSLGPGTPLLFPRSTSRLPPHPHDRSVFRGYDIFLPHRCHSFSSRVECNS